MKSKTTPTPFFVLASIAFSSTCRGQGQLQTAIGGIFSGGGRLGNGSSLLTGEVDESSSFYPT